MENSMKIAILKEKAKSENRVAITPDIAKLFIKAGYKISIEKGAGDMAGFADREYEDAGCVVSTVPLEVVGDADIVLKVQPTPPSDKVREVEFAKKGAIVIGFLNNQNNRFIEQTYAEKQVTALSMELVPRITKAQNMDALSSQTNLAGYRAVIEAAYYFKKSFPMFMTAAGTVSSAKVLVLGAGVAGLQASATAKRLGAVVTAYDVRAAAKEQVESVGAKFISLEGETFEGDGGYAREVSVNSQQKQEALLGQYSKKSNIIITTAQIPGKPAPILITKDMVKNMDPGSVIVDMAAISGGNVEGTELGKIKQISGVTVIGLENLANNIPYDSSKLYAKNLYNLVMHMFKDKKLDVEDEVIKPMILTHKGKILTTKIG
jgi:NAD(P) transhydrogenase subunit alpha